MITVDGRCHCPSCRERTEHIYRMIGICINCGERDILMLFREGDRTAHLKCPTCGCERTVQAQRRAMPDEIPAVETRPASDQEPA